MLKKIKGLLNQNKPNFLFVLVDDQPFDAMGISGRKSVFKDSQIWIDSAKEGANIENFFVTQSIMLPLQGQVFEVRDGGGLAPLLASGWEYQDATTLNVSLKDGVKFHSGNILDADDVVYSFNRLMNMGQGFSFLFGTVDSVTAFK